MVTSFFFLLLVHFPSVLLGTPGIWEEHKGSQGQGSELGGDSAILRPSLLSLMFRMLSGAGLPLPLCPLYLPLIREGRASVMHL